jgi:ABC-2 type transport system permease protein
VIAAIVTRSVADRRRSVVAYGIGLGLMVLWVMAVYPSVESELSDYVDAMPDAMKSLFGMEELTDLAGFVHAEIFSLMGPLVFLGLAIAAGSATIAGEERERVLPVVLATGVGRGAVVRSKLAALAVEMVLLGAITLASLLVGSVVAGGGLSVAGTVAATVQLGALGLLFGVLALAAGAATGRRSFAAGIAAAAALVTYVVDALSGLVDWLEPLRTLSPFHWYAPGNPLVDGVSVGGLALLLGCSALLAVVAVVTFDRRDVGV